MFLAETDNLTDIITWGLEPTKELLEILDEYCVENFDGDDEGRLTFLYYELREKIQGTEDALLRLHHKCREDGANIQKLMG